MKSNSEPGLAYYDPKVLTGMADQCDFPLTWQEMVQQSELGHKELVVLLRLSERCNLGMHEIILLYLRYWENMDGQEIGDRYGVDRRIVSKLLIEAKKKLHPELIATISLSRG